jgi:sirohydrochlorin ferrochelatase
MFVWQKRLKRSVGIFLILMLVFSSCLIAAPFQSLAAAEESPGVLILAHGAGDPTWTVPLWEAANELKENLPYPVAIGFLEYDEPDIPAAVEQLNAVGVNKIVAVPLFISSYSNHIEEIKYILGLRKDLPDPDEDLERASPAGEVILIPAVDDHPLMAEVLTEQIKPLIKDPAHEVVVLAAHGSDSEEGKIGWKNNLESLGQQIQKRLAAQGTPVKGIRYGYVFEGPTPSLRKAVDEAINTDGATALVVPVMVSEGFFTGRMIPNILKEFADDIYRYPEPGQRALLTFKKAHANRIVEWRAANELWPQPEVIKDGKRLHLTLDKCQEIAQGRLDSTQINTTVAKMIVPALRIKMLPLSHMWIKVPLRVGTRYGGSSMTK